MNHQANATDWQPGDLVIHDGDAKRADMLMIVLSRIKSGKNAGVYRTRYLNTDGSPSRSSMHEYRKTVWKNCAASLHDPRRFDIYVPDRGAPIPSGFNWRTWPQLRELPTIEELQEENQAHQLTEREIYERGLCGIAP